MLDHLGIRVSDYPKSKSFFESALAPLGYAVVMEFGGVTAGLGAKGKPDFWISKGSAPPLGVHVALLSADRPTVDVFYQAAIAAGARDNGAPGPRTIYHPDYYGAFVLDPAGHNIEAVCHTAP